MFTGLVEETGTVTGTRKRGGSVVFSIRGKKTSRSLHVDDSIAIEGVCLTVIRKKRGVFDVQAVEETLKKTTLGRVERGDAVNLERPLLPTSRLGGHFVLGHIDGMGTVKKIENRRSSWMFWIRIPAKFRHLIIPVGSVAVNGVSLTIAERRGLMFGVSIIPHTWEVTTFRSLKVGDRVNIEFDVLGKYVHEILRGRRRNG